MITVIIPTMWKAKEIGVMLPLLDAHPLVGEIILIDNAPENKDGVVCSLPKVKYVTFGKNIFPVPSWNYGWENAKYEKLLIINDDVLFSISLVDAIYDQIIETNGTITLSPDCVLPKTPDMRLLTNRLPHHIKFIPCVRLKHKAAVVLGIHKNSYIKIPEELLIHYNDTFLFKICEKNGKHNISAKDLEARTNMSTTVKNFRTITDKESRDYPKIFEKYGIPK